MELEEVINLIIDKYNNFEYANSFNNKVIDSIDSLKVFPKRYRIFFNKDSIEFRRLNIENYFIAYFIDGNNVIVTNLISSKAGEQLISEILKNEF